MTDFAYDQIWTQYNRESLRERYGVGTFVAVIDGAVIEWGSDRDEVRERAEVLMGDPVYVGVVSSDPECQADSDAAEAEYRTYKVARERWSPRRRFPMMVAFEKMDELRLLGAKTEYIAGRFVDGGAERRFCDHDYRLLIEHGAIPKTPSSSQESSFGNMAQAKTETK